MGPRTVPVSPTARRPLWGNIETRISQYRDVLYGFTPSFNTACDKERQWSFNGDWVPWSRASHRFKSQGWKSSWILGYCHPLLGRLPLRAKRGMRGHRRLSCEQRQLRRFRPVVGPCGVDDNHSFSARRYRGRGVQWPGSGFGRNFSLCLVGEQRAAPGRNRAERNDWCAFRNAQNRRHVRCDIEGDGFIAAFAIGHGNIHDYGRGGFGFGKQRFGIRRLGIRIGGNGQQWHAQRHVWTGPERGCPV